MGRRTQRPSDGQTATRIGIEVFLTDDAKEGAVAFKEKRAPDFQMQ